MANPHRFTSVIPSCEGCECTLHNARNESLHTLRLSKRVLHLTIPHLKTEKFSDSNCINNCDRNDMQKATSRERELAGPLRKRASSLETNLGGHPGPKGRKHLAWGVSPKVIKTTQSKPRSGDSNGWNCCRHSVAKETWCLSNCGLTPTAKCCRHFVAILTTEIHAS